MEDIYLTDTIFIRDQQMYYESNQQEIKVKSHNWHNYLSDLGWTKLHKQWIKKLNSYLDKPKHNSLFGCLDCGGDGNCLFHCLSFAMDNGSNYQDIRNKLSNTITTDKFEEIIRVYRILDETGDFEETWDPQTITYTEFKDKIIEGGHEYWGDSFIINLLQEILNINILILYSNEYENIHYHYPLMYPYQSSKETILLLYENDNHFQVIGYFQDGNMKYKFKDKEIPYEIRGLVKLR